MAQRTLPARSGKSRGVDLASALLLLVSGVVILGLLGGYWFEILCTGIAVLLIWVPVHIAGLCGGAIGAALGAALDAEIDRRRRQDELVRLLLQAAQREGGR